MTYRLSYCKAFGDYLDEIYFRSLSDVISFLTALIEEPYRVLFIHIEEVDYYDEGVV